MPSLESTLFFELLCLKYERINLFREARRATNKGLIAGLRKFEFAGNSIGPMTPSLATRSGMESKRFEGELRRLVLKLDFQGGGQLDIRRAANFARLSTPARNGRGI